MSDSLVKRAWIEEFLGYRFPPKLVLGGPGAPAPTGSVVAYAKSRLAWLAARQKVASEVEKLRGGLITAFAGFDIETEIHSEYTQFVAPILTAFDESLADKLDEATNATNPATRAKLVEEAKAIIERYESYLAGAQVITALDSNPLVPLTIRQTLTTTLTALAQVVH